LARVDFDGDGSEWIEGVPPRARAMGLLAAGGGFVVVYSGGGSDLDRSGILRLDAGLQLVATRPLATVRMAHSLIAVGDGYLVNSSGTDALVMIRWQPDGTVTEEVAWSFGAGRHEVHVNSVIEYDGRVLVTMFGRSTSDQWVDARDGAVWDTTRDRLVCSGLVHPHSLFQLEDRLCVLESFTGRVLDVTDGRPSEMFRVPGYARGACIHAGALYVATSVVRMRAGPGSGQHRGSKIRSRCAIYRIDLRTGDVRVRDLCRDGPEIYDLCPL